MNVSVDREAGRRRFLVGPFLLQLLAFIAAMGLAAALTPSGAIHEPTEDAPQVTPKAQVTPNAPAVPGAASQAAE